MRKINMPDIWGQGSLFAYCGAEGKCDYNSLVGTLMGDCLGIQFRNLSHGRDKAYFIVKLNEVTDLRYKCITSDMICAEVKTADKGMFNLDILFVNQYTFIMRSKNPIDGKLMFDYDVTSENRDGVTVYTGEGNTFAFAKKITEEEVIISVSYNENTAENAKTALETDADKIIADRMSFYEALPVPEFRSVEEEKLYYKCFSILRSTIYSPNEQVDYHALTPDRFPHRGVWLWDTAFIVSGLKHMSDSLAREALLAILQYSREDGFLPHMNKPDEKSEVTQPPVISWAVLELYKYNNDISLLEEAYERLSAYLLWDINNRDLNGNGLPEWVVGSNPLCRCGESGMDNTPRFDEANEMDCIDFAAFLANDMRCLAEISDILGKTNEAEQWRERYSNICEKINTILWDDEDGFYYDRRLCDDKFHKVKSVASFMTLFAGVCDKEKAAKMVEHLKNSDEFGTAFPIPTVSADDKTYPSKDMFCGTVWLNFNYLTALGLREYGYIKEAEELEQKTIDVIKQWYINDGIVYEFYDSKNEVSPSRLSRKGIAIQPYMPEIRIQSVRDFTWGCCAVIEFLLKR